jgi:hypothetical protein
VCSSIRTAALPGILPLRRLSVVVARPFAVDASGLPRSGAARAAREFQTE